MKFERRISVVIGTSCLEPEEAPYRYRNRTVWFYYAVTLGKVVIPECVLVIGGQRGETKKEDEEARNRTRLSE